MAGRGRPKGSAGASFLGVHLGELNRVLKEDAIVMVSRKYAEQLHLTGKPIKSENNGKHLEALTVQADFKVEEFDDVKVELSVDDF